MLCSGFMNLYAMFCYVLQFQQLQQPQLQPQPQRQKVQHRQQVKLSF